MLAPVLANASDLFQARKNILVVGCAVSVIGAGIAPGSSNIYRLIIAQILQGIGFAANTLAYAVPSEIVPRRWRPMTQGLIYLCACSGALLGQMTMGGLVKAYGPGGWRKFYWMQLALWATSGMGIWFGYKPRKRQTAFDELSTWEKIRRLDLVGSLLLTIGLTFFLTGLTLGGNSYGWANVRPLVTLIIGVVGLLSFFIYEWKGTSTGILHHDMFRGGNSQGRLFAICIGLIFIEGMLVFAYAVYFPML